MSAFQLSRLHAALAAGLLASAGPTIAQTCATPWAIMSNTAYTFDTCQGETNLVLACGVIPLAGRATVVGLNLPYPAGSVSVLSLDANYQPMAFLLRASCSDSATCADVVMPGPGMVGTINFSSLDSGSYFLVVAADANTTGISCGHIFVTANVTPEQEGLMYEGVFRSGMTPIWP
jgi:hypothetical protein